MSAPLLKDNVAASLLPHDALSDLIPVCVSGDGNCFFHAVKVALAATGKCLQVPTASDLRRNCADELAWHVLASILYKRDNQSVAIKQRTVVNFKRCFLFL